MTLLATLTIEVLRAFCVAGQRVEPGSQIDLPRLVAAELIALGKAQVALSEPAAAQATAPAALPPARPAKKRKAEGAGA